MKNLLKKLLLVSCVSAMLVTPTSIFANELPKQETLEAVGIPENGIMPIYTDRTEVIIPNGETYYFVNKVNGQPFLFKENTDINVQMSYSSPNMFEYGIVDEDNNIISYGNISDSFTGETGLAVGYTIPKTGRYKFFVTNYSPDSLSVYNIRIDIVYPE